MVCGVWEKRHILSFVLVFRFDTFFLWGWMTHDSSMNECSLIFDEKNIESQFAWLGSFFSHFLVSFWLRVRSYGREEISFVVRFCRSDDVFWIKYSLFILAFNESWDVSCLFSWLEILTGSCSCKNEWFSTYNQSLNHGYWYVSSFACLAWVESGYGRVYDQSIGK